jgi:hypothetical protein
MKRQIPGLHLNEQGVESRLEGLFLVCVQRPRYQWHPQKPFVEIGFVILEPKRFEGRFLFGALVLHRKSLVETQLVSPGFWLRRTAP